MNKLFGSIDKAIFFSVLIFFVALFTFIFAFPETANSVVTNVMNFTLYQMGWIYVLCYALFLVAYVVIGIRWGHLRLGKPDDKPEYSFFSWIGLLFGAGLGVGLVFFGVTEPASFFTDAMYAEDGSRQAASDAMRQAFFHWSLVPWSGYGLAGLAIGYFIHRRNLPALVSSTLYPLFGKKVLFGALGKVINIFATIAMVCGIAMSLGYAATQFTAGLAVEYNVENTPFMIALVILGVTLIAILSCAKGLKAGIKFVSDANMWIVIFLTAFAFITGPTIYIIGTFFQATGDMIANFPWMMFFLDVNGQIAEPLGAEGNWVGGWTVFYWAWWCAFVPFVGGFLADISKGRTIREFVFATLLMPGIMCCIWFATYGGGAIEHTLFGGSDVAYAAAASQDTSLFLYLQELPLSAVAIPIAMLLVITLILTSMNSATHVIGRFSLRGVEQPPFANKALWLIIVALFAISFTWLGGLLVLRYTAVVFAFPFVIIMVLMTYGLIRDLKTVPKEDVYQPYSFDENGDLLPFERET